MSDLIEMVVVNCREGAVSLDSHQLAELNRTARFDEAEVAIDGRMLPHEWLNTGETLLKTDALDHHADDFLPSSRDIAWDVAGAIVELELDGEAESFLAGRITKLTGDSSLPQRLPFYCMAYAAYRLGYSTLALESLDDAGECARFRRLVSQYRRSLEARGPGRNRSR